MGPLLLAQVASAQLSQVDDEFARRARGRQQETDHGLMRLHRLMERQ